MVMMVGLAGGGTAGRGGGSCGFEENGLVPFGRTARAVATSTAAAAAIAITCFFDCFHFTYFDT